MCCDLFKSVPSFQVLPWPVWKNVVYSWILSKFWWSHSLSQFSTWKHFLPWCLHRWRHGRGRNSRRSVRAAGTRGDSVQTSQRLLWRNSEFRWPCSTSCSLWRRLNNMCESVPQRNIQMALFDQSLCFHRNLKNGRRGNRLWKPSRLSPRTLNWRTETMETWLEPWRRSELVFHDRSFVGHKGRSDVLFVCLFPGCGKRRQCDVGVDGRQVSGWTGLWTQEEVWNLCRTCEF